MFDLYSGALTPTGVVVIVAALLIVAVWFAFIAAADAFGAWLGAKVFDPKPPAPPTGSPVHY